VPEVPQALRKKAVVDVGIMLLAVSMPAEVHHNFKCGGIDGAAYAGEGTGKSMRRRFEALRLTQGQPCEFGPKSSVCAFRVPRRYLAGGGWLTRCRASIIRRTDRPGTRHGHV
jgi:hypothetical protein